MQIGQEIFYEDWEASLLDSDSCNTEETSFSLKTLYFPDAYFNLANLLNELRDQVEVDHKTGVAAFDSDHTEARIKKLQHLITQSEWHLPMMNDA